MLPFHPVVAVAQRVFEIVSQVLVEGVVFPFLNVLTRTRPQRFSFVDRLPLNIALFLLGLIPLHFRQLHGNGDVIGVFFDDAPDPVRLKELARVRLQVQGDGGAPLGARARGKLVIGLPRGTPAPGFGLPSPARLHRNTISHDEGRVEAHPKLANELGVLLLITGELLEKPGRAGARDRTQVLDQLLPIHADAIVLNGEGSGVLIEGQANAQITVFAEPLGVAQGLEAELIHRIRGVRDQLSKKYLSVGVERVNHQLEELLGLGLKAAGFRSAGGLVLLFAHGAPPFLDGLKNGDGTPPLQGLLNIKGRIKKPREIPRAASSLRSRLGACP